MDYRIVRGRFLTLDKLTTLLDANGLDVNALIVGAKKRLEDISLEHSDTVVRMEELFEAYEDEALKAEELAEEEKSIESVLDSLISTEQ